MWHKRNQKIRFDSSGQTSAMIFQRLATYNIAFKSYALFILSYKHIFKVYHLCLEVHCIRYELCLFYGQGIPLTQAFYDQHRLRSSKYFFKVISMTRTPTWDLSIRIRDNAIKKITILLYIYRKFVTYIVQCTLDMAVWGWN